MYEQPTYKAKIRTTENVVYTAEEVFFINGGVYFTMKNIKYFIPYTAIRLISDMEEYEVSK